MQNFHRYCLILACTTLLLTFFTGCNKLFDYIKDHPDGTTDVCQIKKLVVDAPNFEEPRVLTFTYTSWGAPAGYIQPDPGTAYPNGTFRYDSKRRMTDYITLYPNGYFENWYRYAYDANDRIIRDTVYSMGVQGENPSGYYDVWVNHYEYDQLQRIIHVTKVILKYPEYSFHTYYTYDAAGNLVVPGAVYDNKINLHRTNKTWMFLDRNYSVNNAYATAYNSKYLPTKMTLKEYASKFLSYSSGTAEITYKCK